MILVIDIGNTNIVLAFNENSSWIKTIRIRTKDADAFSQVREHLKNCKVEKCVISSVVPSLTSRIFDMAEEVSQTKPLLITLKINSGLNPESIPPECGSDIICNLLEGHKRFPDSLVTVADFGTAFTTETVDENGNVLGVTIAPGMMTSVKALYENTAQIPEVCLDVPETVLGRNTVASIRAGVFYGFAGQLTSIVKQIRKETGKTPVVIVTGGFSKYIQPFIEFTCITEINLTLEGALSACLMN